ncbi:MAG: PDZ domain-containing protein [Burkholderiales bacterium]|nr:PDZ domain-containing protein [Burkholderiales bacterium]
MRRILAISVAALLTACANGFQQFYKPYADTKTMPDVELLAEGATPAIYRSADLKRDVSIARSRGYVLVGESSLNGQIQSEAALVAQAKTVRATMVLLATKFTNTQTVTVPLFLPNNQTTYSSGTVNGTYGSANYNGTSTTYGTTVVPLTSQQQRFDQDALFFVKSTRKYRVGIFYDGLSPELRARYERNTGIVIMEVMEGSPAFAANVMQGDVVLEINGTAVVDRTQFQVALTNASAKEGPLTFKILRNGTEKFVVVNLPAP